MTSRLFLKAAALAVPFAIVYALLALGGPAVSSFFGRLFAGSAYEQHRHDAYTIYVRKGDPIHLAAAKVVEEFVDKMMAKYEADLHLRRPTSATPISIHLLERREELEKYGLTRLQTDLANNGGYFLPERLEIALVLAPLPDANDRGLRHEMTHALMYLSQPKTDWPTWLSEGMASYFESSRVVEGVWRVGDVEERVRHCSPLPLAQVLGSDGADFTGPKNSVFYDSAHLLVAFLIERKKEKFFGFYSAVRDGDGKAFARFFDPDSTETEWQQYVRELKQ